jgi:hypothetical protein
MAKNPVKVIKLSVQSTFTGHISKGIWVAQAIAGGELCNFTFFCEIISCHFFGFGVY